MLDNDWPRSRDVAVDITEAPRLAAWRRALEQINGFLSYRDIDSLAAAWCFPAGGDRQAFLDQYRAYAARVYTGYRSCRVDHRQKMMRERWDMRSDVDVQRLYDECDNLLRLRRIKHEQLKKRSQSQLAESKPVTSGDLCTRTDDQHDHPVKEALEVAE